MSKKVLIIIISCSVLMVGGMGAGFFIMWSKVSSLSQQAVPAGEETEEEAEEEEAPPEIGPMFSLDTFIVNTADAGGTRYLRVTMDLELSEETLMEELQKRMPQIRDSILMILPTRKIADIQNIEGKIALRDEIKEKLNSFLQNGSITNLYFKEFVIQ